MAEETKKEVLLVGFGAVGAILSLGLQHSGLARVTVVARSNYNLVREHGVHVKSRKYGEIIGWKPDRVCNSVSQAADQAYDYVLVASKALPDVMPTSAMLAPFLEPPYTEKFAQPAYLLIQNGLNIEVDIYNAVKDLGQAEPKIISSSLYILTNMFAPEVVEHFSDFDRLELGMYRPNDFTTTSNTAEESRVLEGIGSAFKAGGIGIEIVPEIQRKKFAKNYINIVYGSITTLTNYTTPALYRPPPPDPSSPYSPYVHPKTAHLLEEYTMSTIKALLLEVEAVGRALGFPDTEEGIPSTLVEQVIQLQRRLHEDPHNNHVPSMLLDARNGRPIEVEVVVGSIVRFGQSRNVPIPRLETLYALLLVIQNQALRKMESS